MNQQKEKRKNVIHLITANRKKYSLPHASTMPNFGLSNCSKHKQLRQDNCDKTSAQLKGYRLASSLPKQLDNQLTRKLSEIKASALKGAVQHAYKHLQLETRVLQ